MARRAIGTRPGNVFAGEVARGLRGPDGGEARCDAGELERTRDALRESHARLIEMERLAAGRELASDVADAINNPLAALLGRLQMRIEERDPPDPEDRRLYALASRIAGIVQGLSELSCGPSLEPVELSCGTLADRSAGALAARCRERGVALSVRIDEVPSLRGDAGLLERALTALLQNAVEASASGSSVDLHVAPLERLRVARFCVRDVGPGIAPEHRARIFDPFFTTRPGAQGLGLALARSIALAHGGRIRVRSGPGPGTEAVLDLPLPSR